MKPETVDVCAACGALWKGDETEHIGLDGRPGTCANSRYGWYFTVTIPLEKLEKFQALSAEAGGPDMCCDGGELA